MAQRHGKLAKCRSAAPARGDEQAGVGRVGLGHGERDDLPASDLAAFGDDDPDGTTA